MNDFIDIYIDLTLKIVTINIFCRAGQAAVRHKCEHGTAEGPCGMVCLKGPGTPNRRFLSRSRRMLGKDFTFKNSQGPSKLIYFIDNL